MAMNDFFQNMFGGGEVQAGTGDVSTGLLAPTSGFDEFISSPLTSFGLGLLATGLDDKQGFGRDLLSSFALAQNTMSAAAERRAQQIENAAARQQLLNKARQREARQELLRRVVNPAQPGQGRGFGVLEASSNLSEPETVSLLAEASPELVFGTEGLLADRIGLGDQQTDPLIQLGNGMTVPFSQLPSDAQMLVSAGMVPGTEEFSNTIQQSIANGGATAADQIQAKAQATLARLEARSAERDERKREFETKRSIKSTFRNIKELAEINRRLEGTIGETGLGFDHYRQAAAKGISAVKALLGTEDAAKAEQIMEDIKRFETLALKENVSNIGTLQENLGSGVTQFEFEKFLETGPSPSNPADVNRQILADQLEDFKSLAQFQGVEVPDWVDEEIARLRGASTELTTPGGATVEFLD